MQLYLLALITAFSIQINWLEYTDSNYHFKMKYPDTWTPGAEQGMLIFKTEKAGTDDNFVENVNVIIQDLTAQPMSLTEFTKLSLDQYAEMGETVQMISIDETKLAGSTAKKVVLQMNYYGMPLKLKQLWFIKDNKAYLLTYTALDSTYVKFEAEATELMMSFEFTK